jgi:hypothetical protein
MQQMRGAYGLYQRPSSRYVKKIDLVPVCLDVRQRMTGNSVNNETVLQQFGNGMTANEPACACHERDTHGRKSG